MGQSWTKAHDSSKNTFWENYPSIASPIIDTELNRNEVSVDTVDDRVITLDTTKAEQSDLLLAFKDVSLDETTGIITFTKFNNTTATIDTSLEKIATNFRYIDDPTDPHYQYLELTLVDGTKQYVDLRPLLNQFEFTDTSTIHFTVAQDGTVTANVIDGSITENKLQPNFLADCRSAKAGAESAEADAIAKALVSEGYANGEQNGVPVTSESPYYHNNAKYWEEQAQSIVGSKVDSFNGRTGAVTSQSGDYAIEDITPTNATDGQIAVARSDGQGGIAFAMENIPSSGHTIVNPSGTDMAQEDKLQFTGKVNVTDDSVNGKTIVDISNQNTDRTFNVAVSDWVANADSTTATDYPYVAEISTAYYNANSKPIWQMNGSGAIPTSTERDDINLVLEAVFDTTGITLYATDIPSGALVLEVKGD